LRLHKTELYITGTLLKLFKMADVDWRIPILAASTGILLSLPYFIGVTLMKKLGPIGVLLELLDF